MTTVGELGERALVQRLVQLLDASGDHGELWDDAAVLPLGDGTLLVASIDATAEPTHYPAAATSADKGWYAAAVTVSDVASMGAEPLGLLLAAGLPASTPVEDAEEMLQGFDACAREAGARVLGGDTKEQPTLTLTSAGLGRVAEHEVLTRAGADPGDVLCVTGTLGGAAAGLRALDDDPSRREDALRLLRPPVRVDAARLLATHGATACIDLSDGLSESLHLVADASGVGFVLRETDLPAHPGAEPGEALHGGGDFEILATVPPGELEAVRDAVEARGGTRLTAVGRVVEPGTRAVARAGRRTPLEPRGWEHFRSPRRNP